MNETLFYIIWGIRTFYVLSIKTVLFTVLFLFFEHNFAIAELSILGILINLPMVFSAFFITRLMDRQEIKSLLVTVLLIQVLTLAILAALINGYHANLIGIILSITVLFIMSSTEVSLFDKSIVLLLPETKRGTGVSLGLATTALGYIVSPLIASLLFKVIASEWIIVSAILLILLYLVPLMRLNKKYIRAEINLANAVFRLKEFKIHPLAMLLLLTFSLTTVWTNFISFLIIPILKFTHPQWFVGMVLSLSGIGALLGGISVGWMFQNKANRKSLSICFSLTLLSMMLFVLYASSISLSIILALLGGITSAWSYGISQIISQNSLDHNKIAGFYMFRNAFSSSLLMVFYAINAFFARSIDAMVYALVIFLFIFILLYSLVFPFGKSVVKVDRSSKE
ncbi:MFS transporter [Legionella clemsonensis]|uniref:Major Facilitator Superfamily protein n=1 Tax=Legionella clemsonensis TaxID=1867846 RepID=A0A222P3Q9_9GAMM|nr:MFS transporter [Legionella clemsonensis]ASQ46486.1 Major Facilitator Superfamily protein [Legionella clemsonensis]